LAHIGDVVVLITSLFLLASVASSAFNRHASDEELLHEKHGRVIDAATGLGISQATVIAIWDVSFKNTHSAGYGCILRKVTTTTASGNYVLPDVTQQLDLSKRGSPNWLEALFEQRQASSDYGWRIVVFKPGYIREGDEARFGARPTYGSALGFKPGFAWQGGVNPDVEQVSDVVSVRTIGMREDQLVPIESIQYLSAIARATTCPPIDLENASDRTAMLTALSSAARTLACQIGADVEVDGQTALDAASLIGGTAVFEAMHRLGEPISPPWRATTGATLCSATKDHGDVP
jgi:hypothetical protein